MWQHRGNPWGEEGAGLVVTAAAVASWLELKSVEGRALIQNATNKFSL